MCFIRVKQHFHYKIEVSSKECSPLISVSNYGRCVLRRRYSPSVDTARVVTACFSAQSGC